MKKAIGTCERCRSEFDIKSRRLTVFSWSPPGGKTHEMRPSLTDTPDLLIESCAAACALAIRAAFKDGSLAPHADGVNALQNVAWRIRVQHPRS